MKALKIAGVSVGGLVLLFVIIGLFLPTELTAQASTIVEAPPEVVFAFVNDVEKRMAWSPWKKADKTMQVEYSTPRTGVGAWYTWTSEHSGAGKLTITTSEPPHRLTTHIVFDKHNEVDGAWELEPRGKATAVTWRMHGRMEKLGHRWAGLIMKPMMEAAFADGLVELKAAAEAAPRSAMGPGDEPAADEPRPDESNPGGSNPGEPNPDAPDPDAAPPEPIAPSGEPAEPNE